MHQDFDDLFGPSPSEPERNGCDEAWRLAISDMRWKSNQDGSIITGWQLVKYTGLDWRHMFTPGLHRMVRQGTGEAYNRIR